MKLKSNFIPRSLRTSILAKFFFCIDSLIISVYSVTYKCLSLVLGVLQKYFNADRNAGQKFFYFEAKACASALGQILTLNVIICQLTAAAFTQNEFLTGLFLSLSQNLARFLISDKFHQVKKDQSGGIHLSAKQRTSQRQKEYSTTE